MLIFFLVIAYSMDYSKSSEIGVDVGGSFAKVVYFRPNISIQLPRYVTREKTEIVLKLQDKTVIKKVMFIRMPIGRIQSFVSFIKENKLLSFYNIERLNVTGGGAFKFESYIRDQLHLPINKLDEMKMLVQGLNFVLNNVENEVFIYCHEKRKAKFVKPHVLSKKSDSDMFPYLLVNIGSGVSILKVTGRNEFQRISGSSIGGGTFWGLLRQMTDVTTWDEVEAMSVSGNNKKVDLLVGDIYGCDYSSLGLDSSVIASSFGKFGTRYDFGNPHFSQPGELHYSTASIIKNDGDIRDVLDVEQKASSDVSEGKHVRTNCRPILKRSMSDTAVCTKTSSMQMFENGTKKPYEAADIVKALLFMICNNIAQVSFLNATLHRVNNIYFAGGFIQGNPYIWSTLSYAIKYWSKDEKKAMFLVHDGYLGALGSLFDCS